jgi:hypothetical protein
MSAERFKQLVEEQKGFEFIQAYRDDIDYIIGGKGNTYWFAVSKNGKVTEIYIGVFQNGVWTDRYEKGSGVKKTTKDMSSGSTIKRICEQAYLAQEENWVKNRKPRLVEDSHPHYHYVYGFGDKAVDISEKYGVTIAYSDIKDVSKGFHLRDVSTGSGVELP